MTPLFTPFAHLFSYFCQHRCAQPFAHPRLQGAPVLPLFGLVATALLSLPVPRTSAHSSVHTDAHTPVYRARSLDSRLLSVSPTRPVYSSVDDDALHPVHTLSHSVHTPVHRAHPFFRSLATALTPLPVPPYPPVPAQLSMYLQTSIHTYVHTPVHMAHPFFRSLDWSRLREAG